MDESRKEGQGRQAADLGGWQRIRFILVRFYTAFIMKHSSPIRAFAPKNQFLQTNRYAAI